MISDVERTRMLELNNKLIEYSKAYYNGQPLVSDEEYDRLYNRLEVLEKTNGYTLPTSITRMVGAPVLSKLEKRTLDYPCLSLKKTKSEDEFKQFCGTHSGVFSVKLDGLTTQLVYEDGYLKSATTRGNGTEGADVTRHVMNYSNVPCRIDYKDRLVITGESIITNDVFNTINSTLPDDEKFSTCRNLASGTLNQLNPMLCKTRGMKFFAFYVNEYEKANTLSSSLKDLEEYGFDIVPFAFEQYDGTSVIRLLKFIAEHRKLPYDGLVVQYNDLEYGRQLGSTEHHPRSGLAYKFEDEEFETIFRGVEIDITRGNKVSMVAEFDPVEIDGTIVSRASIPNYDIFTELELGVGDTILVRKANMIIPQIVDNVTRSGTYRINETCPYCGHQLSLAKLKNTTDYFCLNEQCRGLLVSKLAHFCSSDGMNIKGLSEATLRQLVYNGLINDFVDIYKLRNFKAVIRNLDGFGAKSCDNLLASIDASRTVNLSNLIYSLGINQVGSKVSKSIELYFSNYLQNLQTSSDKIKPMSEIILDCLFNDDIDGVTELVLRNIHEWFYDNKNTELFKMLLAEVNVIVPQSTKTSPSPFTDKKVCVTGTLSGYTRKQIGDILESMGAILVSSVSSTTDYLICGESAGSKYKKAVELGVEIITDSDLKNYIDSRN